MMYPFGASFLSLWKKKLYRTSSQDEETDAYSFYLLIKSSKQTQLKKLGSGCVSHLRNPLFSSEQKASLVHLSFYTESNLEPPMKQKVALKPTVLSFWMAME